MQYIDFKVQHQTITRIDKYEVVGGSQNYLYARFTFCAEWADITATAVFSTNSGKHYSALIEDGECLVPWEVLTGAEFWVGVFGGKRVTTSTARVPVKPGVKLSASPGVQPTPSAYETLMTELREGMVHIDDQTELAGEAATQAVEKAAEAGNSAAAAITAAAGADSAKKAVLEALNNVPAGSTVIVNDLTTGGMSAALSAEMGKVLAYRSVKNLVGNSDFLTPVNQRGTNQYFENASGYCIDLWRKSSNMLVEVKAGGIGLTCSAEATTSNSIAQWLTKDCTPDPGTPLTLAIMDADGEIYVARTSMPDNGSRTSALTLVSGAVYARINAAGYDNASLARLILFVSIGKTIDLKWIALYVGDYTKQTLPPYQSKGYGAELRECQRYQMVFPATAACQYWLATAQSATQAKICVQLPDALRSVPALTFDTEVLSLTDNTAVYPVTAVSVFAKSGNVVVLNLTTSGLTAGKTYTLRASAATKIIFDANL